ncbi:unnamed protein product, partial [Brenthis ino]
MTDNNKKRGNSFRKIFPNIFFSHKTKEKSSTKDTKSSNSNSNCYQNPQSALERYSERIQDHDDRIYENLSPVSFVQNNNDFNNIDILSNHSSSSTLVSENVKNIHQTHTVVEPNDSEDTKCFARPMVPPRPQQESHVSQCQDQLPDVYYHSLEKLADKISPLEEIEIYKASKVQADPASVGAEIKKVSTKFLISPKKEAEVRKIQPIRARSLSPHKDKSKNAEHVSDKVNTISVEKPYNYSAPTSPIAVGHKMPNMPTRASPYEHVKRTMIEEEEKRNSMNRSDVRKKSTMSPTHFTSNARLQMPPKQNISKEKTRQRVEAFYWQKIKELKEKEDEYLLRQSINSSMSGSKTDNEYYSNCSTPNSLVVDPRINSLSRCMDINGNINRAANLALPFTRGAPERRTDSYINNKNIQSDADVVYRYSEKYQNDKPHWPIFRRGSLTQHSTVQSQQPKRVSFERKRVSNITVQQKPGRLVFEGDKNNYRIVRSNEKHDMDNSHSRNPPVPPIRTTSVVNTDSSYSTFTRNYKNTVSSSSVNRSACCESESGSEASEIQHIMDNHHYKGKHY